MDYRADLSIPQTHNSGAHPTIRSAVAFMHFTNTATPKSLSLANGSDALTLT